MTTGVSIKTKKEIKMSKKNPGCLMALIGCAMCLPSVFLTVCLVFLHVEFEVECSGHLKRAADASSVKLALSELDTAIVYMEKNELTEGYTSVLWKTPDEDVGFWYENIVGARDELAKLPEDTSQLERSNMLMKLRETLLDSSSDGVSVTVPAGASRHPYNLLFAILSSFYLLAPTGAILVLGWLKETLRA
jgi:hypothetical protein